jgi:phthiocerol/phenolphthiocerol synthesis type-I polyketide synthase C
MVKNTTQDNFGVNLFDKLHRARQDSLLYVFGEEDQQFKPVSNEQLVREIIKLVNYFAEQSLGGKKAILIYQTGAEFVAAILACFIAGVVAIPLYPPFSKNTVEQFKSVVADANPDCCLTSQFMLSQFNKLARLKIFQSIPFIKNLFISEDLSNIHEFFSTTRIVVTDLVDDEYFSNNEMKFPDCQSDVAFFQYTSGSTSCPKGVMVKHDNLFTNIKKISKDYYVDKDSVSFLWLPQYHDMGLIGGILTPLFNQILMYVVSPLMFLKKPLFWLQSISEYRVTHSGSANFAYEICVKAFNEKQMENVDLSCWSVAFNGSDYIHDTTINKFYEKFKDYGFRKESFLTCYGLAESTLYVVSRFADEKDDLFYLPVKNHATEYGEKIEICHDKKNASIIVSSGLIEDRESLKIVNPDTFQECQDLVTGEVWLKGASIAQGYYNKLAINKETFHAHLLSDQHDDYFRTGDLGFIYRNNLYIISRLKDIIILKGKNYFPYDIEKLYQSIDKGLRKGRGTVFLAESENKLIVLQEVTDTKLDMAGLANKIHDSIKSEMALAIDRVVFLKKKTLPVTTSGKLKRFQCKEMYIHNDLNIIGAYEFEQEGC